MSCQVTKCCASQMTNCTAKCNLTSCDQMLFSKMSCDVKSRLFSGSDFVFSRPSRRFLNEKLMHKRTKNSLFAEKSSQFQSDLRFFFFSLSLSLSLSLSRSNTLSVPSMIWQIYSNLFPIDPPVDDDDDEREDGEGGEGLQGETRGAKRCLILIIILDRDVFDRRNAQIGLKWAIIYFVYYRS